jgi:hypothetical protein
MAVVASCYRYNPLYLVFKDQKILVNLLIDLSIYLVVIYLPMYLIIVSGCQFLFCRRRADNK